MNKEDFRVLSGQTLQLL